MQKIVRKKGVKTLGINISHLGKFGKSSSKCPFWGGYGLVPWRVYIYNYHMVYINGMTPKKNCSDFLWMFFNILKNKNSRFVALKFFWKSQMSLEKFTKVQTDSDLNLWQLWLQIINFTGWFLPRRFFFQIKPRIEKWWEMIGKKYMGEVFFAKKHP